MFSKNKKFLYLTIALVLSIIGIIWAFATNSISMGDIQTFIKSFGKFGPLIFILLFNLKTVFIIFPYAIFVLLGGNLFGSFYSICLSILCVLTSSTIAFWIARMFGKDRMRKFLEGRFPQLDEQTKENGFNIILFMRLSCLFPADALSFAAGLTHMKYSKFLLATVIGMIPEVISLSMLGDNIRNPFSKEFSISIGLVILTASLSLIVQKIIKSTKKQGA